MAHSPVTRAERRFEREKAIEKTRQVSHAFHFLDEEARDKWVTHNYKHRKNCSCVMCGNPRHHAKGKGRLTLAELRQEEAESEL
jgi:putative IMPACT (imprinted ancient) family translation regulator